MVLENPRPEPGPFDELVGKSVPFLLSYESSTLLREPYCGKAVTVIADLTTVQFGGDRERLVLRPQNVRGSAERAGGLPAPSRGSSRVKVAP